ncbi:hypothetical protein PHLCEN_2v995 [Hermanssonia centrifuga]|uniref:P-loop containing nucleoside triphosphate hydrolase protein n=1 Tax=Hermanssonia centrifuga TaxID=98765 RepID=A0A2R6S4D1_9APHY|nr:hypothetical protein PHLCEN_2v995 [Hermanssonia centrifuga]
MITRIQGIVTQVILDHALRIRLKADVPESSDKKDATAASTPDTISIVDEGETSTLAEDQRSSDGDDRSTTAASGSAGAPTKDSGSIKDVGTKPSEKKEGNMIGKINNLVTTDLSTFEGGQNFLLLLFFTPFQIVLSVVFLYAILGWSVLVGVGVMLALLFLPGMITKLSHGVQVEKMKRSDARVQTVTEALGGVIRTVKLFGWEQKMSERIDAQRQGELKAIRKTKFLWLATSILSNLIPMATMVVTFTVYTLIMKKELTASRVFSSVAVFETLQNHFKGTAYTIPIVVQAKVAFDRINDFLLKTELLDAFSATEGTTALSPDSSSPDVIGIRAATFTWDNSPTSGTETPGSKKRNFKLCINDELMFKRGHINLVIGQTGSGKTSLLMALLGEMHYIPMGPGSMFSLPRGGGVAYHAQESWVMNETIRNNILFGSPYDEERYKKVIEQCALERDLSLFDAGDETEVGEKGITLSPLPPPGAQVLAALDVHTAQWIVDKCFQGDLIQGRTVILVTHNVALATPIAEYVVCLSPDGGVLSTGSLSSALAKDKKLSAEVAKESKQLEEADQQITEPKPNVAAQNSDGKLVVAEEISVGHVGWTALKLLFSNTSSGTAGLVVFWVVYFGALFFSKLAITTESWVLALWARQYEIHMGDPSEVSVSRYLSLYVIIFVFSLITSAISFTVFVFGTVRASRVIHKILIETLLRSTLRWLDKTPSSRIITRCTQDIAAIDANVVGFFNNLVHMTFDILLKFCAVIIMSPIFTLPGILMGVVGGWLGHLYMKAQLSVKRELSNAKSPVLGHIGAAIAGLVSIRAYGSEEAFRQELFARINRFTRVQRTFWDLNRWISVRGELLAGSFSTALSAYLVYGQRSDAASTGFSLTMAVGFSSMVLWWVRNFNEFEVQGNSLERIHQYLVIDQEPKPTPEGVPPASWPTSGDLRVENLSARYSEDGPKVLEDISFHVKSGERVGIVGRTGSGKSSLTLALLRCILTEGTVYYDGLATDKINLDVLRSHITIIPQVPELLSGTLRENIDPFSQYEDAVLNDALRSAGLFSLQSETDEGRLTLDSDISSGGSNLSVGQRQIIALARAIVRQSKLLILDEATSAIDYETDSIIQESLRKEVAKDVTLLTVAHRLQTIMDSDKIMVLDAGRIVEFGKPAELLDNEKSFLRSLVDASGDKEKLFAMAAGGRSL